jgi:hypothetical protein
VAKTRERGQDLRPLQCYLPGDATGHREAQTIAPPVGH